MKQRINLLTLGVSDLEKSMRFYQDGFGWQTQGIVGIRNRGTRLLCLLHDGIHLKQ